MKTRVIFDEKSIKWVLNTLGYKVNNNHVKQNGKQIHVNDIVGINKQHGIITNVFDLRS